MANSNSFTNVAGQFRISQAKGPANKEGAGRGCEKSTGGESQREERGTFYLMPEPLARIDFTPHSCATVERRSSRNMSKPSEQP